MVIDKQQYQNPKRCRVELVSNWDSRWRPLKGDFNEADAEWLATYYRLIKKREVRVLTVKL